MLMRIEKAMGANIQAEIRRIQVVRLPSEREAHPVHSALSGFAKEFQRMSYGRREPIFNGSIKRPLPTILWGGTSINEVTQQKNRPTLYDSRH